MKNSEAQRELSNNLDKRLFWAVSLLLFAIFMLLTVNLFLQWNNYDQGIKAATQNGAIRHDIVITYSRAMDFAFTKTSTIFLGFILVFVGALYVLRIEKSSYQIDFKKDDTGASFQTASPGLVLVSLGVIAIIAATYNKTFIEYSYSGDNIPHVEQKHPINKEIDINSVIKKILFKYDSQEITDDSLKYLDLVCSYIKENNINNILINAHGDGDKDTEYEMALSDRRQHYLKKLINKKCSNDFQITTTSYGEEKPFRRDMPKQSHMVIELN